MPHAPGPPRAPRSRSGRATPPSPASAHSDADPDAPADSPHPLSAALARLNLRAGSSSPDPGPGSRRGGRASPRPGSRPGTPVVVPQDLLRENANRGGGSPALSPPGSPAGEAPDLWHPKPVAAGGAPADGRFEEALRELEEKRTSTREAALARLIDLLSTRYMGPASVASIEDRAADAADALRRSVRRGEAREAALAAKALSVLFITLGPAASHDLFEPTREALSLALATSRSPPASAALASSLALCTFVWADGRADADGVADVEAELAALIEKGAADHTEESAPATVAAVEGFALLYTLRAPGDEDPDLDATLDAHLRLLSHTSLHVRVAAGCSVALVLSLAAPTAARRRAYPRYPQLAELVAALAGDSDRSRARKDRSEQRRAFRAVLREVDAERPEEDVEGSEGEDGPGPLGTRMRFKGGAVAFDTWAKSARLSALRAALSTGLSVHFESNPYLPALFGVSGDAHLGSLRGHAYGAERGLAAEEAPGARAARKAAHGRARDSRERERSKVMGEGRRKRDKGVAEAEAAEEEQ